MPSIAVYGYLKVHCMFLVQYVKKTESIYAFKKKIRELDLQHIIGSLSNKDKRHLKVNSRCFKLLKLYRTYSISFNSSNVGNFFWRWKDCQRSSGTESCLVFTSITKREIRYFHVALVQWRQRNVQKKREARTGLFCQIAFCRSRWRRRRRCSIV